MNNQSLISVLVPVYNAEKYLPYCLDSIIKQTYQNFELILINDASTDSSAVICDEYALIDKRIRVIHQIKNGGESVARNIGLENAKGKYILFIDADDEVLENHIESFLYIPDIPSGTLVHAPHMTSKDGNILNSNNTKAYTIENLKKNKTGKNDFLLAGPAWSKLLETDIIKKNNLRFKEDIKMNVDHTFHLEYLQYINSYVNIGVKTLIYFDRSNSLSKRRFIYEEYERRLFYILPLTSSIVDNLNLIDNKTIIALYSTPVNAILSGLYSLYNDTYANNRKKRHIAINRLKYGDYSEILCKYWIPANAKEQFVKHLIYRYPAEIIDSILRILIIIKNYNQKSNE